VSEVVVPAVQPADVPEDAFLLDVREDDEWTAGHLPGAVHVPMGEIRARVHELSSENEIVVVCRSGHRSAHVTAYLLGFGLRARNLDGGAQAWAASALPLVSENGAAPVVL